MNRTAWLKLYDRKESMGHMMTEVWAAGVNDALYVYATSSGCSASSSPSGAATAAATADMLRSDDEVVPRSAAIVAFQRLIGCDLTDQLPPRPSSLNGLVPQRSDLVGYTALRSPPPPRGVPDGPAETCREALG
jgi:hypothetical protein